MIDHAGIMMAHGSIVACEKSCGTNDNMFKSHYHDYFEIYYLESGERYHMIREQLYCLHPGEFILFAPYVMHHSYGMEDVPFQRLLVYFSREVIASSGLLTALEKGNGVYKPDADARQKIHKLLEDVLREQSSACVYGQDCQSALLTLLAIAIIRQTKVEKQPERKSRISNIIGYIHDNYAEDIHLEQLAQHFYLSRYYLCREFKRCTNSTIIQYINITRIMNAQRKFMETNKNITQISKETGFSNITHFNRVFKSVVGMSPSEYKKCYKTTNASVDLMS